jgi:hypothetical protein
LNIQSTLRKVYNNLKNLQIPEEDITAENFSRASYLAGMLDSAKIFMNIYNGDVTEERLEWELRQLNEKPND